MPDSTQDGAPHVPPDSEQAAAAADAPGPRGAAVLGPNRYGKAQIRLVRVDRSGPVHRIKDLNVSVSLSGDLEETHYTGDNRNVLPTDTAKNTVYALAAEVGIGSAEGFGIALARHFVTAHDPITAARIGIEEYGWQRVTGPDGENLPHSFTRAGGETGGERRTVRVAHDGRSWLVFSGLAGLTLLNTTDSEFRGFARDRFTTLKDASDRILATEVRAHWCTTGSPEKVPDAVWEERHAHVRRCLTETFAGTYSHSLQQTLYRMGAAVLEQVPDVAEIRLSLPNKHHFLVDMSPFRLANDNEVFVAADRPYGLIEATVLREGAVPRIPDEPGWA